MFPAQVRKEVSGGPGAASLYVFVALADALDSFGKVLAFPLKISSESVIQRSSRILTAALGVLLELCLAFRLEWDRIHG
jgi:hypothetical protein